MTNYTKFAAKGAAAFLILSLVGAALGYVVRILLAKNLTIEEFGLFYAVLSFLGLIGLFKSLGVDRALVKYIPEFAATKQYPKIPKAIMYASGIQLLTNTLIITVLYFFVDFLATSYFKTPDTHLVLLPLAIAYFVDSFAITIKLCYQGFKQSYTFAAFDAVRMGIISVVILVGFHYNLGLLSPVIAYVITPILLTLFYGFFLLKNHLPRFFEYAFKFDKKLAKNMSAYGLHGISINFAGLILGYTDVVMLTYFTTLTSVAMYNVAMPTARILVYIGRSIGSVLLPLSSEFWAKKKFASLKGGMESIYKYAIVVGVPLACILLVFADLVILLLYGQEFAPATLAMQIMVVGYFFAIIHSVNGNFFAGIGRPDISSTLYHAAAAFNIVANLIFIPLWGFVGAAATTAFGYVIMMAVGTWKMKTLLPNFQYPLWQWTKIAVAGVVFTLSMAVLKSVFQFSVWVEAIAVLWISGVVYVAMLYALRVITVKECKELYARVAK